VAEWLTLPEAAKVLRVSRVQVFRMVKKGRLPAARVGRQWMVSRVNLERLLVYRENVKAMLKRPFGAGGVEKSFVKQ
jgi:excisionase family DNA binding protein